MRIQAAVLCLVLCLLAILEPTATLSSLNIARQGTATHSSAYGDAAPERAIDGNRESNFMATKSCTHTEKTMSPWWRLDLLKTYQINSVTITNRGDCCHERLDGAEIRIGNSLGNNGNNNPRCAAITSIPAGVTKTFVCNEMEGRYINIVVPGRQEYLTLCEVEVTGVPTSPPAAPAPNIARQGTATHSSAYGDAAPERAIDGNRESNFMATKSCTHTEKTMSPWWRLDLLRPHKISSVTITNRWDCCHERLDGAEIRIGNSLGNNGNNNPRCAAITSIPAGVTKTFVCNEMEGRYINIVVPGRQEYLTLCEVEVTGVPTSPPVPTGPNIARQGKATHSSAYGDAAPERAIDGDRESNFMAAKSCTHTEKTMSPWWRLDLLKPYKITSVTITNRGDCCHERLDGAEIRIGNYLGNNGNDNPRCTVIESIPAGASATFLCNGMEGRYINIVVPGRQEYLSLCEVEVYGE